MIGILCSDKVTQAQRIVIGVAERMPALGSRLFAGGAVRVQADLAAFLGQATAEGRLRVPDPPFAAARFIELAGAGHWKPRLYCRTTTAPPQVIEVTVAAAVDMFLAAYGNGLSPSRTGGGDRGSR